MECPEIAGAEEKGRPGDALFLQQRLGISAADPGQGKETALAARFQVLIQKIFPVKKLHNPLGHGWGVSQAQEISLRNRGVGVPVTQPSSGGPAAQFPELGHGQGIDIPLPQAATEQQQPPFGGRHLYRF